MKPELTVTEALISHAAAIVELVNSAYRGEASRASWTTEAELLDGQRTDAFMIEEIILDPKKKLLVAFEGETLVGCACLEKTGIFAHLGMLTVALGRQNSGLGRAIMEAAEAYARKNWFAIGMEMWVIRQRKEIIDWYQRRGYELRPETHPFPYGNERFGRPKRHDLEFVTLRKKFPPSTP